MSDAIWYYVDRNQQRNGPVTAAAVAEAYGYGWIDDHSLVWREGLGAWSALAGHRDELGITGPPGAPIAPAPGYRAAPAKSGLSGCLIAAIVVGIGGVFMIAVLAAIALPAYQDYIARSQVATGLADIRGGVTAFEESIQRNLGTPASVAGIGLPGSTARCGAIEVQGSFDTAGGGQTITCFVQGNPKVDGAVIELARTPSGNWDCTVAGTEDLYVPRGCSPR